ncbi:unnamed protein product [Fraxinus pennsylvanica]|uniref:Nucleotidyl transferase domain-containing protein n=1 Tax=Fraxinus pennsylvanica TaxID=56036 RepID=A0AAD2E1R4_9LAMI|nr:unnamed protein product [Fraxinus pennsylvanica]
MEELRETTNSLSSNPPINPSDDSSSPYYLHPSDNPGQEQEILLHIYNNSIVIKPLGTAGPIALARDKVIDGSGKLFFVVNSDVISEYRFKEIIEFHKTHGGEASIMVTNVTSW